MAATTVDRMTPKRLVLGSFPVPCGAVKILKGTLVMLNTSGYAVVGADTASNRVLGWAKAQCDNSAGSAGDKDVIVEFGIAEFAASSIAITNVGAQMYIVDNQTFDETTPANSVKCGILVRCISATKGEILILPGGAGV